MNLIYIHTHDTGRYISPYGYNMPTPNLMQLAKDGILFRKAFCANPTCSASRATLLSGMYPHSIGMTGLAHRGFSFNDYKKHIVSHLSKQGYSTALSGMQHEAKDPAVLGYDQIIAKFKFPITDRIAADLSNADAAVDYLKEHKDDRFFLSFGMCNTHRPFPENDEYDEKYIMPPHTIADTPENRADFGGFKKSVACVDQCVGKVIDAVKENGLWDNSIIMFTTDHGIAMPNMKCTLYDTGIGVSLILAGGGLKGGQCIDELISHVDLFPTLCDLMNIPTPDWCEGHSAVPLMQDGTPIRQSIFSEINYHAAYQPTRSVRTNQYKLIKTYYDTDKEYFSNIDDSIPKDVLVQSKLFHRSVEKTMLFDLLCDPLERQNLAFDDNYKSIIDTLSEELEQYMKKTNDPLLTYGYVPMPEGAMVNKPESISATEKDFI